MFMNNFMWHWSNDAENSALITEINYSISKYITIKKL